MSQEPSSSEPTDDEEPVALDEGPIDRPVIDFHTHLFPTRLFQAIWQYFEQHLWPVRYQGETDHLVETLLAAGIERFVFSTYAHRPALARDLNQWSAEVARRHPRASAFGTFHPLDDVAGLAEEAFGTLGLAGFEVHCQVQRCYPDDPGLFQAYHLAEELGKICLIHCGRAPEASEFTDARRFERLLRRYPGLTFVVAHLGAPDFERYFDLLGLYENLFLDTTMVFTGFHPWMPRLNGLIEHQDGSFTAATIPTCPTISPGACAACSRWSSAAASRTRSSTATPPASSASNRLPGGEHSVPRAESVLQHPRRYSGLRTRFSRA